MRNSFVSKTDLAQAYFPYINPRSARHKLMRVINDDSTLMEKLVNAGYNSEMHLLSPMQVDIIVERLGNPWK